MNKAQYLTQKLDEGASIEISKKAENDYYRGYVVCFRFVDQGKTKPSPGCILITNLDEAEHKFHVEAKWTVKLPPKKVYVWFVKRKNPINGKKASWSFFRRKI